MSMSMSIYFMIQIYTDNMSETKTRELTKAMWIGI